MSIEQLRFTDANRADTAAFLTGDTKPIRLKHFTVCAGFDLLQSLDGKQIRMIHDGYTAHALELRESGHSIPGISNPVEIDVWRTCAYGYDPALRDYSTNLLTWLTERYSVIVTNPIQNRFWEYRLAEAVAFAEKHVWYFDGVQPLPVDSDTQLTELIWGERRERLFIITGADGVTA